MITQDRAIAVWQEASGLTVDAVTLRWWGLFNAVKGRAIWTSAAREYRAGGCLDPMLAISGWYCARRHDEIIAEKLLAWGKQA